MPNRSRAYSLPALTCLVAVCSAPLAHASGFQLREQSPSAQGTAFAGISAGGEDASVVFFNPAATAQLEGFQFCLGASEVMPSAKFKDGSASRAAVFPSVLRPISGAANTPNAAHAEALPVVAATWQMNRQISLGFSLNAPFGMATDYDAAFIGRYHARKSDLAVIDFAPSVAWRINDQWSIGGAVVARKATAEISNNVDFGAIGAALGVPGALPGQADGLATVKGDRWATTYRLGLIYQPTANLRLGLSHQASSSTRLEGTVHYDRVPAALGAVFRDGNASAEIDLPATTSLGMQWKVSGAVTVMGETARTNWSRFEELRVKFASGQADSVTHEAWRNTWFASMGVAIQFSEALTLRTGLAMDQGAAPDATRTPRIPDGDRIWISTGLGYRFTSRVAMDLAYTHIFVKDSTVQLSTGTSAANPDFFRGNLDGRYQNQIDILAIQTRMRF